MKKSEELRQQASYEENDFKALGLYTKALRENRSEKFIDGWLPAIQQRYDTEVLNSGTKYTINTEKYGKLDYFPKANKLLIRKDNKWKKPGLRWIINNLFKE